MRRIIVILILFFSSNYFGFSQGLSDITFGTDSTIDIVTWNIEWFPKRGMNTADSVGKIIKAMDADIIGFQEIDDTALFRQVIDDLPEYRLHIEPGYFNGLAYAYKPSTIFVIDAYKIYSTGGFWQPFPRSPVVIEFLFQGKKHVAINNHYKCCGDGFLDLGNTSDEEARRFEANTLLKAYIDSNFAEEKVLLIGDLNDMLTDSYQNNVFRMFYDDATNYKFADEDIARNSADEWSYPSWPSHLDHILITNELFDDFDQTHSSCQTIKVDDFMKGGISDYDYFVSDHRPVGIKLKPYVNKVGLASKSKTNLEIFPNPTNGNITIELPQIEDEIAVSISDFKGNIIFQQKARGSNLLNLNFKAPNGIYILEVNTNSTTQIKKLFKLKN